MNEWMDRQIFSISQSTTGFAGAQGCAGAHPFLAAHPCQLALETHDPFAERAPPWNSETRRAPSTTQSLLCSPRSLLSPTLALVATAFSPGVSASLVRPTPRPHLPRSLAPAPPLYHPSKTQSRLILLPLRL
ncbi:uncharacterized protein K452DRAFT_8331 [Aplosporella prunicola CBS 121167]|uniref:Uncharacterized protein n=1 Tax=Aplosporella prunicola CBS 121167 TaxID=1176127 RepID=A0A6A6BU29_9PEZI|nr:uncharacterized protein K452DRAFT_8331 [Aplosporella prunicola CBS 121167]KAF2147510.1 hypothetical protein K452DRAFT_8331 [Aplosporella prunicola CBS 121167]